MEKRKQCDKCSVAMRYRHNANQWECTCGRKIVERNEESENGPESIFTSGDIPQEAHLYQTPSKRKNRTINTTTRKSYLANKELKEEDLFIEENGREYWLEEGTDGEQIRVYLPTRFKNKDAVYL